MTIRAAEFRGKTQEFTISGAVTRQMDRETKIAYVSGSGGGYLSLPKLLTGIVGRTVMVVNNCAGAIVVVKPVLGGSAVALNTVAAGQVGFFTLKSSGASSDVWVRLMERSLGAKMSHSGSGVVVAASLPTYSPDCRQVYRLTDCSTGAVTYTRADLSAYVGQVLSFDDLLCQAVSLHFGNDPASLLETELTNLKVWAGCSACVGCEDPTWLCDGCCFVDGESYMVASHILETFVTTDGCPPIIGTVRTEWRGGGTFDAAESSASQYAFVGSGSARKTDTSNPNNNDSAVGEFEAFYSVCPTREVQRLGKSGTVSGGTFRVGIDTGSGVEYSTALPWNVGAAELKIALEAIAGVGLVTVTAAGGSFPTGTLTVEVISPGGNLALFTIDNASITGGGSITVTGVTNGSTNDLKRVLLTFPSFSSGSKSVQIEDHPKNGLEWSGCYITGSGGDGYCDSLSVAIACSGAAAFGITRGCGGQIANTLETVVEVFHP